MDEGDLRYMRESAIGLIQNCGDADLLDLVCKLLVECGVKAEE